ncbi:MAG: glucose 1-dehydrogenase [Dehalococcoidales bacterium]|nr:glucose 1-dehydrogenase [Dehalococcoidales bacterium]
MANLFRVDNQIAVVIGGAGGIGEALGNGLAEYGAKVVIADVDINKAEQVASDIRTKYNSPESVAIQFDITDEKSVASLRDQVISKFGTVDILVNSQGVNVKKAATEFPVDDWNFMFNINVRGTMLTCREFGKIMIEKKKGKVINLSSVRGIRATFWGGNEGYSATKGAIDMITRSLASEWAQYKINVNAIGPSTVATPFSEKTLQDPEKMKRFLASCPLGRVGQPIDIVGACIFLASPASDFITGQVIYLDGGLTAIG